jgi:hypothetical protein
MKPAVSYKNGKAPPHESDLSGYSLQQISQALKDDRTNILFASAEIQRRQDEGLPIDPPRIPRTSGMSAR